MYIPIGQAPKQRCIANDLGGKLCNLCEDLPFGLTNRVLQLWASLKFGNPLDVEQSLPVFWLYEIAL